MNKLHDSVLTASLLKWVQGKLKSNDILFTKHYELKKIGFTYSGIDKKYGCCCSQNLK